jgi:hypothetical protein
MLLSPRRSRIGAHRSRRAARAQFARCVLFQVIELAKGRADQGAL